MIVSRLSIHFWTFQLKPDFRSARKGLRYSLVRCPLSNPASTTPIRRQTTSRGGSDRGWRSEERRGRKTARRGRRSPSLYPTGEWCQKGIINTMGGRHSSVVLSAPTIMQPWVRIPSTPSMHGFEPVSCIEQINRGGHWVASTAPSQYIFIVLFSDCLLIFSRTTQSYYQRGSMLVQAWLR